MPCDPRRASPRFLGSLVSDEEIWYEEARLELVPGWGELDHRILVGPSFESNSGYREGVLQLTDRDTFGMPLNYLDPVLPPREEWMFEPFGGEDYALRTYGAFLQYELSPLPRLHLTTAGRYDRLELENVETFQEGERVFESTYDAFSPKLSALYELVRSRQAGALGAVDLNLYGAYSEAFKPPRTPSSLTVPGEEAELEPEDITNVEVGLKGAFADGRGSFDAVLFRMKREGIVVSTRDGPFFSSNAGEQDFRGVELSLGWTPTDRLSVHANAAFYDNRYGQFVIEGDEPADDVFLTDNRLPMVPDIIVNAGGVFSPTEELDLTLDVKHVGDRYVDPDNALLVDAYRLVHAGVSYSRGPVRVTLAGRNILDEEYFSEGDSNAEALAVGARRQLMLVVSLTND